MTGVAAQFRGVVRDGIVLEDGQLAFVVAHPHPGNDWGGGPGPDDEWHLPPSADAYRNLVDEDECDPEDASFEIREFRQLAVGTPGAWRLSELPAYGTIDALRRRGDGFDALVSAGGGAAYVARVSLDGKSEGFDYRGTSKKWVRAHATWRDDAVILAGSESFALETAWQVGVCRREGEFFTWEDSLPPTPARVLALHAHDELYAGGGSAIWKLHGGQWETVHSGYSGELCYLDHLPSGEVIAGTKRGDVIVGARTIGRVGAVRGAAWFGDALYVVDDDRVYRHRDGSFEVCVQLPRTAGDWGSAGALRVYGDALWVFGAHVILRTGDGVTWTAPF